MIYKITIKQEKTLEEGVKSYDDFTEIYEQILVLEDDKKLRNVITYLNGGTSEIKD